MLRRSQKPGTAPAGRVTLKKEILGRVLQGANADRAVALQDYADQVTPGLAAARAYGFSLDEAIAMHAGISQATGGNDQRISTNAQIQLMGQVDKATAGDYFKDIRGKSVKERMDWIYKGEDIRAKAIQAKFLGEQWPKYAPQDARQRAAIEGEMSRAPYRHIEPLHAEAKSLIPAMGMIMPGIGRSHETAQRSLEEFRRGDPSKRADDLFKAMETQAVSKLEQFDRSLQAITDQIRFELPGPAAKAILLDKAKELRQALGMSALGQKLEGVIDTIDVNASVDDVHTRVGGILDQHLLENRPRGSKFVNGRLQPAPGQELPRELQAIQGAADHWEQLRSKVRSEPTYIRGQLDRQEQSQRVRDAAAAAKAKAAGDTIKMPFPLPGVPTEIPSMQTDPRGMRERMRDDEQRVEPAGVFDSLMGVLRMYKQGQLQKQFNNDAGQLQNDLRRGAAPRPGDQSINLDIRIRDVQGREVDRSVARVSPAMRLNSPVLG
jgi:hypothetical protein